MVPCLIAEAGRDGNLVSAFGTTAIEYSGARFGLHASEKAMSLGAVTAVGLKGALRHKRVSGGPGSDPVSKWM